MNSKEIDVSCPCCATRFSVDVASGRVVRTLSTAKDAQDPARIDRWDVAQDRVRERTATSADKLDSALESERGKSARLDELFRKAQVKHQRGVEDEPV